MTTAEPGLNRGQFIRNAAKGSVALVGAGGVLASMNGVAFASAKGDLATLQTAFIAESLAVKIYSAIVKNFHAFKGLQNKDYFVAALKNEQDHLAFLKSALGSKAPKGFTLEIPRKAVSSTANLTATGAALELAFVETYLGAVKTLSSTDLKLVAAKVAANEATHYSFFDAAAGGHAVLPSVPGTITIQQAAAALKQDGFLK